MQFLEANAETIVTIGPFVDVTDGFTPETGITLGTADEAEILKHGSTSVVDISGATWAAVTNADGYYSLTLTASHTDTEGQLTVIVQDDSVCRPVKADFMVLAQAAWASLCDPKDSGFMEANVAAINNDTGAAVNLESQYDGTGLTGNTYPATQKQIDFLIGLSRQSAQKAESLTKAGAEPETNTYASTAVYDGTYHTVEDDTGTTDVYYQFDIGADATPTVVEFIGYFQSSGDSYTFAFHNWNTASWDTSAVYTATSDTVNRILTFVANRNHVGTGANIGKVRFRVYSTDGTAFVCDRLLCYYNSIPIVSSYDGSAVWCDETAGTSSGVLVGTDGTSTNRSDDFDNAQAIADDLGFTAIKVTSGNNITLAAALEGYEIFGNGANFALNSQNIGGTTFYGCNSITGTGGSTSETINFVDCTVSGTIDTFSMQNCIINGAITQNGSGAYKLTSCSSGTVGAAEPTMNFSGAGAATTVNVRGWNGGGTWIFDSNCSATIECIIGGTHTITTGGGDVEFRGNCRALALTTTGGGTTNIYANCGPITIAGTGGTVNIYGQNAGVTDGSSGTTVTVYSADVVTSASNITAIKAKTDNLTFTSGTNVDANIQKINDITLTGTGVNGDSWGPA